MAANNYLFYGDNLQVLHKSVTTKPLTFAISILHSTHSATTTRFTTVPLVDECEATFDGDKAKLFWPTSLDGKKIESETYKIIAVSKAAH
jgi:hypothetical protein